MGRGKINWKKSAQEIEQQVKKLQPGSGNFTFWLRKDEKPLKIKILKVRVFKVINSKIYPIGKTLVAPQNELCIQTGKRFLIIEKLQLEGEKEIGSEQFLRNHPDFIGTILN